MTSVIVFCIYYDDTTKAYIERHYGHLTWLYPVLNPRSDKYLESGFMASWLWDNKHLWQEKDYVGCFSWKFNQKITVPEFNELSTENDFIGFVHCEGTVLSQAKEHPQFAYLFVTILEEMGYLQEDITSPHIPLFCCNYFLCKPMWMELYLTFLRRAIQIMENKQEIQEALYSNAMYQNKNNYNEDRMRKIFHRPYYTHHCFLLERFPSFFFWRHGAKIAVW
jgi:hypothetical protein